MFEFVSEAPSSPKSSRPDAVEWQVRRIPLSYGKHSPGQLAVVPRPFSVPFESLLERDAIAFLSARPGFRFVAAQPLTISYVEKGVSRRYTPDLLVVFDPVGESLKSLGFKKWTIVEVKPASMAARDAAAIRERLDRVSRMTGLAGVCLTDEVIERGGRRP
jgi:hypothetical protein